MIAADLSASCSDAAGGTVQVDQHMLHNVLERHVRDHLAELAEIRPSLR
jgi:hypothetical protein